MRDQVEQLQADIEAGVAELVEGEDWKRWLRVAARFPRYSFRNSLLIQIQRPDASVVMGYRAWQALGHQVRKGEKSISILAPCTYKTNRNENEDQDHTEPAEKEVEAESVAYSSAKPPDSPPPPTASATSPAGQEPTPNSSARPANE